mmetsp:Transcript_52239/g.84502  ORF Transcript_52239/g.84502 Transcript_52239/m.84502 type:complete len:81 (+) Transcript_52239:362-604(+)
MTHFIYSQLLKIFFFDRISISFLAFFEIYLFPIRFFSIIFNLSNSFKANLIILPPEDFFLAGFDPLFFFPPYIFLRLPTP